MPVNSHTPFSSIIISVYKDDIALDLIIENLHRQKQNTHFEIIISEDGESESINQCVKKYDNSKFEIQHLTQKDAGFRKNIALNRAIKASRSKHLIFIDGDCIPHPNFIAAHQQYAKSGIACSGRRLELGKKLSKKLRARSTSFSRLTNSLLYFLNMIPLILDKTKNVESGIYSPILQYLTQDRPIRLLGCNFSCNKEDIYKINGFNEDYLAAGTGEDSDIDWRLIKSGIKIKKVKFSAIQYHLHHTRSYGISEKNIALLEQTKNADSYYCTRGLNQ